MTYLNKDVCSLLSLKLQLSTLCPSFVILTFITVGRKITAKVIVTPLNWNLPLSALLLTLSHALSLQSSPSFSVSSHSFSQKKVLG